MVILAYKKMLLISLEYQTLPCKFYTYALDYWSDTGFASGRGQWTRTPDEPSRTQQHVEIRVSKPCQLQRQRTLLRGPRG